MKKVKNLALMAFAVMSVSCSNWGDDKLRITPPALVQAYINPEVMGLNAVTNASASLFLLPCKQTELTVLKENPDAYITAQNNRSVYDSLRGVHGDYNKMSVDALYLAFHGDISSEYDCHYQVLWKEIKKIDVKTVVDLGDNHPAGSLINDMVTIKGLINMKEELSRSPQPANFPYDRYRESMPLTQFNSRLRPMVALPLVFQINGMEISADKITMDVTFADGTVIPVATGYVQ